MRNWYDWSRLSAALLAVFVGPFAVASEASESPLASKTPLTTYEKFLPFGVAGDSSIQHLLGYMFFYGEGVEQDFDDAVYWFKAAAEEGDYRAQRNLGLIYARAVESIPARLYDPVAANLWLSLAVANPANPDYTTRVGEASELVLAVSTEADRSQRARSQNGQDIYQSNCAGCHGFDGYGAYPVVPSFAAGEGLSPERSTLEAFHTEFVWNTNLVKLDAAARRRVVDYILQRLAGPLAASTSVEKAPAPASTSIKQPLPSASMLIDATASSESRSTDEPLPSPTRKYSEVEEMYLNFCGGCHGFNGVAWYVNSPSFALNERLHKSDAELARSIRQGIGVMPSWEYMLQPQQIESLVRFIRSLAPRYERGIVSELHRPDQFLRFRPDSEAADDPR